MFEWLELARILAGVAALGLASLALLESLNDRRWLRSLPNHDHREDLVIANHLSSEVWRIVMALAVILAGVCAAMLPPIDGWEGVVVQCCWIAVGLGAAVKSLVERVNVHRIIEMSRHDGERERWTRPVSPS